MAQKIILPGWKNLSSEEKEMAEGWIKSILFAKKASANLIKLVSQNQANPDFMARLDEILNQSDDFEIIESDTAPRIATVNAFTEIIITSCESVCKGDPECLENCQKTTSAS